MRITRAIPTVVAVPARNEADRIEACLTALLTQIDGAGAPLPSSTVEILVLVNNTRDATAAKVRKITEARQAAVQVRTVSFPEELAHAGQARKAAMDWAVEHGRAQDGLICTTDADSRVAPDWLWRTWAAVDHGADAVAGVIGFDHGEAAPSLPALRRLEGSYADLQAEVDALYDPQAHNPWPNHLWAWGASLAVRSSAYTAVGGVPCVPLAEDRALVAALKTGGFKVRHAQDVRVLTSSRREGRAPGGLADLIAAYEADDGAYPCDAVLEPILLTQRRAVLRRRLRALAARGGGPTASLAVQLQLDRAWLANRLRGAPFGHAWAAIEQASPALKPRRLYPAELPLEAARAALIIRRAREALGADPDDSGALASAAPW